MKRGRRVRAWCSPRLRAATVAARAARLGSLSRGVRAASCRDDFFSPWRAACRRPAPGARPRCRASLAGARRSAVGDIAHERAACNETPALNPTSAGSAISRIVLSFRANGAIVPNQGAAPRLPRDLVARAARAPTVHAHQSVTSSAAPRDCNLAHHTPPWVAAGARPPGEALGGGLLRGGGPRG